MMVIHGDKLRWLFWLRWKMLVRGYARDKSRIIGAIFLVLFGLPFIGGIAVATFFAYHLLPQTMAAEVLFLVLTAIYLMWIVLPLLEYNINEGLDISKLTLFPLTRGELMASLVLSTLLDIPTVGLLLVFIATIAGWAFSLPLALVTLLTIVIFYVQLVGISQLVLALLMRTLQSRRFRDLSIILVALFSSSCYLLQQLVFRGVGTSNLIGALRHASFSPYLQWLPPGMAARAIQQAAVGNWGISFAWLGVLLVLSMLVLYLWQLVVERGLSTPESGGVKRSRRPAAQSMAAGTGVTSTGFIGRLLSSQTFSIALKDLKYFRRDPQLQALLVQSLVTMAIFIVIPFINSGRGSLSFLGPWIVMIIPGVVLFSLYALTYNVLGFERQGLTTLFLFPVDPKHILWGKNMVVFAIGFTEMLLLVFIAAFIAHSWEFVLPALVIGLAGMGVILGCGNFTSILLPQRMRQMRRGFQTTGNQSFEGGCLRGMMSMMAFFIMLAILVPVLLALILPVIFDQRWIWIFSIPASLLYGLAFYSIVTMLVSPRMLNRVPEILAVVTRE
ncbi:MAG TPA: hypothetical protein VFB60_05650 [Ktedonobacteraceae bacterium]|nr:hypothetical protein [Ktedonobacteraceae bacterium]